MKRKSLFVLTAAVVGSIFFAGCGGGGTISVNDRLPDPYIWFFNAIPDNTGGVDFAIDDTVLSARLAYLGSSADVLQIDDVSETDGATDVSITDGAAGGVEIDRINEVFTKDTDALLVAVGKQNNLGEDDKAAKILRMNINRRVVPGKARLYILNAYTPSFGTKVRQISLQTADPADPLSTRRPQFQVQSVNYTTFESHNVLDMDPGTYLMQARDSDSDAVTVVASKTFTFEANKIYLAAVTGQVDSSDTNRRPRLDFITVPTR